jgi:hypothetical protein
MRPRFLLTAVCAVSLWCAAQTTAPATPAGPTTAASAIKILEPKAGARLKVNFVQLRYGLENASSASGSPTFRLRLDARDPVDTTDTSYTFTGLTPGAHSVSITVVDANGVPLTGTQNEVDFIVAGPAAPSTAPPSQSQSSGTWVSFNLVPQAEAASASSLETGASDMTSLIVWLACGVIIGGIIAAARTRSAGSASK